MSSSVIVFLQQVITQLYNDVKVHELLLGYDSRALSLLAVHHPTLECMLLSSPQAADLCTFPHKYLPLFQRLSQLGMLIFPHISPDQFHS